MAASKAVTGFGYKFQIETATPGTYADVKELKSISPVGGTREIADVTHFESPGAYHEYIGTLRDSNELQLEFNYDPTDTTGQDRFKTQFDSGAVTKFKVVGPTTTTNETISFSGVITGYAVQPQKDGEVKLTATVKITGDQTTAATT